MQIAVNQWLTNTFIEILIWEGCKEVRLLCNNALYMRTHVIMKGY